MKNLWEIWDFQKKNMEELWEFYGIHSEKYWRNCSEVKLKVQTL